MSSKVFQYSLVLVVRQIVHDEIEPRPFWICPSETLECRQKIGDAFSFVDRAGEAIRVYVIES